MIGTGVVRVRTAVREYNPNILRSLIRVDKVNRMQIRGAVLGRAGIDLVAAECDWN